MSGEQTWPDDVDEVDDEVGTQPLVDLRHERALVGLPCWVQDAQGRRTQLPLRRWLGGTAASETDRAVDAAMLRHCTGPTVDLGCGPGRITAALAVRGVRGLHSALTVHTPYLPDAELQHAVARALADGDVDLAADAEEGFVVVGCQTCGGALKPDVVFFGESVPAPRVHQVMAAVDSAGALLVLGSSLTVMSGFRFVLRAGKTGVPVAVVNQGPTRGDDRADLRVDQALGRVLPALVSRLRP